MVPEDRILTVNESLAKALTRRLIKATAEIIHA
jgi:hypothetical protein